MTREKILSMDAGRDMDALIIKEVMGWELMSAISFSPSENMSDAWQIVELLRNKHKYWCMINVYDDTLTVEFYDEDYNYTAFGNSLPLVICKAALLSKIKC